MKFTLRLKGMLAFAALVGYAAVVGAVLSMHSARLLRTAGELERMYAHESALARVNYSFTHFMLKWQEAAVAPADLLPAFEEQVALDIELAAAGLEGLGDHQPQFARDVAQLRRDVTALRADAARPHLVVLREDARDLRERLERVTREVRQRKDLLWASYRDDYAAIVLEGAVLGTIGAVAFGAAMTLFLTRLARDVQRLAARALAIVSGRAGPPVPVTRSDEIGDLMQAVNRMQSEQGQWEQRRALAHEQRFHKEKMAAIGSLAAAVAHEINNPIAAIIGIAQSMKEAGGAAESADRAQLILEQARRIGAISRQIAELTAPHPAEPELLDLNTLVRNTCTFIAYDRRFEAIRLHLELDPAIPAVRAIGDHLTQVLMNLVINAADALEKVRRGAPTIRVATLAGPQGEVVISVGDNGEGMEPAVLRRAFENSYTTKPPHKGRGLGLSLCKSLIEGSGNRIELESKPGVGTTARIHLLSRPVPAAA